MRIVITERRIRFEYPANTDPVWTPRRPEFACAANSVSLMMPTIEPYFVRSARRAQEHLPEPLATLTAGYIGQEAQHHRQHVIFNRQLHERYPGLRRSERTMGRIYKALEDRLSLEFSCAFAAASETMAYSAARWAADHRRELFRGADDIPASLFLWHLAEEVEHKSVAFEIYRHLADKEARPVRSWLRHLSAVIVALTLVMIFVFWGTTVMLAKERRLHNPVAWARLLRWSLVFAFELLTNLTVSLLPGFHPDNLTDPLWYDVWLREFDAGSETFPLWTDVPDSLGITTQGSTATLASNRIKPGEEFQGGSV